MIYGQYMYSKGRTFFDDQTQKYISVYFIPAVRIFLDRQMSDIKARDLWTIQFGSRTSKHVT